MLRRGTADRLSAGRERRHGTPPDCGVSDEVRILYRQPIHAPAVHGAARAIIGLVLEKQWLVLEEHRRVRQVERTLDGEDPTGTTARRRVGEALANFQHLQDTAFSGQFSGGLRGAISPMPCYMLRMTPYVVREESSARVWS